MKKITTLISSREFIQRFLILLIIILELALLYFFRDGAITSSPVISIRTYLDTYGQRQFWLATHMRIILVDIFIVILISFILMTAGNLKFLNFFDRILKVKINSKMLVINGACFFALLFMFIVINHPESLIANPHSFLSLIYTASPLVWIVFFETVLGWTTLWTYSVGTSPAFA